MAMTALQKRDSARRLGSDLFNGGLLATASLGTDDLEAAVGSVDAAMDMVISTVPAEWQAKTMLEKIGRLRFNPGSSRPSSTTCLSRSNRVAPRRRRP